MENDYSELSSSGSKPELTHDQIMKIQTYPTHWQGTLRRVVKPGESVDDVYEELKDFEAFM